MPYTTLYAFNPQGLQHYVGEVRAIVEGDRRKEWPSLFAVFEQWRPRARLSVSPGPATTHPWTHVSYYVTPKWQDLSVEDVPRMDDPRLQWLLRKIVLDGAEYVFNGGDDKFNAAFSIWLPDQKPFGDDQERARFEWWCDTLFYNRQPIPSEYAFLENPDALRAWWPPELVHECAERERQAPFLEAVASRLSGDWYHAVVASEMRRIGKFIEFAASEKCALFYEEYRT